MMLVAGHRGAAGLHPENSRAGVQCAIDLGADFVEVDVHRARDGALAVIHDETVDRTTDGTGRVHALTRAELRRLRLANGEAVPFLEEILEIVRGRIPLLCEIKDGVAAGPAYAAVRDAGMLGETVFISFKLDALRYLRQRDAGVAIGPLIHLPDEADIRRALALGPQWIDLNYRRVHADWAAMARAGGARLALYTPNAPEQFDLCRGLGAELITTDFPDRARAWARQQGGLRVARGEG
jgi:glycerophosphoryl diester phosphodiesterase